MTRPRFIYAQRYSEASLCASRPGCIGAVVEGIPFQAMTRHAMTLDAQQRRYGSLKSMHYATHADARDGYCIDFHWHATIFRYIICFLPDGGQYRPLGSLQPTKTDRHFCRLGWGWTIIGLCKCFVHQEGWEGRGLQCLSAGARQHQSGPASTMRPRACPAGHSRC